MAKVGARSAPTFVVNQQNLWVDLGAAVGRRLQVRRAPGRYIVDQLQWAGGVSKLLTLDMKLVSTLAQLELC